MSDWSEGINLESLFGSSDEYLNWLNQVMPAWQNVGSDPSEQYPVQGGPSVQPSDPYADNPLYQGGHASIYDPGTGIGGSSSSWGNALSAVAKAFGLTNKDGSINLASLLPMLGSLGAGIYGMNQTNKATGQTVDAINKANDQITGLLGGAKNLYDPYVSAGTSALDKMATQAPSNLASKYQPLAGMGGMTLSRFAKGK